jgi:hypothetical protein
MLLQSMVTEGLRKQLPVIWSVQHRRVQGCQSNQSACLAEWFTAQVRLQSEYTATTRGAEQAAGNNTAEDKIEIFVPCLTQPLP